MMSIEIDTEKYGYMYQFPERIDYVNLKRINWEFDHLPAMIRFIDKNGGHDVYDPLYPDSLRQSTQQNNLIEFERILSNCQNILIKVIPHPGRGVPKCTIEFEICK
jgi:hypothetical protein